MVTSTVAYTVLAATDAAKAAIMAIAVRIVKDSSGLAERRK